MSRPLQFRQWSEKFQRFYYWGYQIDQTTGETLDIEGMWTSPYSHAFVDPVQKSEQFTGRNDKNGDKIWKGDILRFDAQSDDGEWYEYTGEVRWDDDDYGFYISSNSGGWPHVKFCFVQWPTTCIIGNIHQNPELLP